MHLSLVAALCHFSVALPRLGAASSGADVAEHTDTAGRELKGRFLHITGMYFGYLLIRPSHNDNEGLS